MTITIGSWVIPMFATILAFIGAFVFTPSSKGGMLDFTPLALIFFLLLATIVSLISWLVWAVTI